MNPISSKEQSEKRSIPFITGDKPFDFVSVAPGLLIKVGQETAEVVDKWSAHLQLIAAALCSNGLSTADNPMWVVSSMQNTITNEPRKQAQSHATGNAVDIAPIYSPETITAPDRSTPSLATDIIKLAKLSELKAEGCFFVVEGDHLHIVKGPDPLPTKIVAFPTLIKWYNAGSQYDQDGDVQKLLEKFYGYEPSTASLAPLSNSEVKSVLEILTAYAKEAKE